MASAANSLCAWILSYTFFAKSASPATTAIGAIVIRAAPSIVPAPVKRLTPMITVSIPEASILSPEATDIPMATSFAKTTSTGPTAAAIPAIVTIVFSISGSSVASVVAQSFSTFTMSITAGMNTPASRFANTSTSLLSFVIW